MRDEQDIRRVSTIAHSPAQSMFLHQSTIDPNDSRVLLYGDQMHLVSDSASAHVDLLGGRLASLRVHNLELLVTSGERPTRWGSFPMVPWCGRLPNGSFTCNGTLHSFPLTSPPHANHGFGHTSMWKQISNDEIRFDFGTQWPFGGYSIQRFKLGDAFLRVEIEVHAEREPMPAMAGWHPWFVRTLHVDDALVGGEAELQFDATAIYSTNSEQIPTGELEPVPNGPWDACFVGLSQDPMIRWPGALDLTISSSFDHWVIFTEPRHALCVEPQSGPPNQFSIDPFMVRPGEPLVGDMTLSWNSLLNS